MRKFRLLMMAALAGALGATSVVPVAAAPIVTPVGDVSLDSSTKVHPLLQYGMLVEPTKLVRMIVQKSSLTTNADVLARLVNGRVVEDFDVLPAFVVELPQSAAGVLAVDPGVRYISPDGPVRGKPIAANKDTSAPRPPAKAEKDKAPK